MGDCECKQNSSFGCSIFSFIISIVIGVIFGVLFSLGLIPVTLNFIKIALVMSAIAMAILLVSLFASNYIRGCNGFDKCVCSVGKCLLIGAIGTFLSATAAATAGLIISSIVSAIFVGLTMIFFIFMIIAIISTFYCVIKRTCKNYEEQ